MTSDEIREIKSIALIVRSKVKSWVSRNPEIDSSDMCGACAIASYTLWNVLLEQGYDQSRVTLVCEVGFWSAHCWVELDDYIIDITGSQFGGPVLGFFRKNEKPKWFADEEKERHSVANVKTYYNEDAVKHLQTWGNQSHEKYESRIEHLLNTFDRSVVKWTSVV